MEKTTLTILCENRSLGKKGVIGEHGFSALIETGLLFITSIWIIYEAVQRLFFKTIEIEVTWYAFAVIILPLYFPSFLN